MLVEKNHADTTRENTSSTITRERGCLGLMYCLTVRAAEQWCVICDMNSRPLRDLGTREYVSWQDLRVSDSPSLGLCRVHLQAKISHTSNAT